MTTITMIMFPVTMAIDFTLASRSPLLQVGMEGADCVDQDLMEQAVILYDDEGRVTVVQPNEDGSYWRKVI